MNSNIAQMKRELLIAEIEAELGDAEHSGRTHGSTYCYTSGCKGPLCRFGNAERNRKMRGRQAIMDPVLRNIINQYADMHLELRVLLDDMEQISA